MRCGWEKFSSVSALATTGEQQTRSNPHLQDENPVVISAQVAGSGVLANAADFNPSRLHAAMSPAAGVPPFFLGFAAFVGKVPHCFPCSFVMSRPLCAQGQQSGAFFAIHHSHARLPFAAAGEGPGGHCRSRQALPLGGIAGSRTWLLA